VEEAKFSITEVTIAFCREIETPIAAKNSLLEDLYTDSGSLDAQRAAASTVVWQDLQPGTPSQLRARNAARRPPQHSIDEMVAAERRLMILPSSRLTAYWSNRLRPDEAVMLSL
jgi:hypothetical protein